MPQGQVTSVPVDGLTTRQRRNRPLLVVHTGEMKGKSTAAFGLALRGWSQGWSIGVFQFVKSAKWKVGEEAAFRALGRVHAETGEGGPVEWHKMGEGWSWARKAGTEADHAAQAAEGWAEIRRRIEAQTHEMYVLDEFTYPMKWGWVDVARGRRRARPPRRPPARDHDRPGRGARAGGRRRPRHGDHQDQASDGRRARRASGASSGDESAMEYTRLGATGLSGVADLPRHDELRLVRVAGVGARPRRVPPARPQRRRRRGDLLRHRRHVLARRVSEEVTGTLLREFFAAPRRLRARDQGVQPHVGRPERPGPVPQAHPGLASTPRCGGWAPTTSTSTRSTAGTRTRRSRRRWRRCTTSCGPGKARYIGASSMYAWQFAKAQHVADLGGWTRFVCMQDHYNLLYREEEREMHPLCLDQGVGVIPWSPLARGRLARRPAGGAAPPAARHRHDRRPRCTPTPTTRSCTRSRTSPRPAGCAPAQVALAWVLHREAVHARRSSGRRSRATSRTRSRRVDVELDDDEIAALEAPYVPHPVLGPRVTRRRALVVARARLRVERQDDGGHRAHGRAAPPRHRRGAVQGRPGLHRPRLPHARRGPARAQPRPGAGRGRPDRPAGPARRGRGGGRGRRGRDGAVRRAAGRRRTGRRRRSPGCSGRRSCWSSTPAGSRAASPRCCTASVPSTPRSALAGVVLNRVGQPAARGGAARGRAEVGLPVLGALPRRDALAVPSRHLGLVTAAEHGAAATRGGGRDGRAGGRARRPRRGDGAGPPAAAGPAWPPEVVTTRPTADGSARGRRRARAARRSAGARAAGGRGRSAGPAFTFGYAEHVELLAAAGAEVVVVDPLRDEALPPGHGRARAARRLPRGARRGARGQRRHCAPRCAALAASGAPVHAECGGLLYLCADPRRRADVRGAARRARR